MQEKFSIGNGYREPLYMVDKKILSRAEIKAINPEDIESIAVISSKEEIRKYYSGNYDGGLIIITLKKREIKK